MAKKKPEKAKSETPPPKATLSIEIQFEGLVYNINEEGVVTFGVPGESEHYEGSIHEFVHVVESWARVYGKDVPFQGREEVIDFERG